MLCGSDNRFKNCSELASCILPQFNAAISCALSLADKEPPHVPLFSYPNVAAAVEGSASAALLGNGGPVSPHLMILCLSCTLVEKYSLCHLRCHCLDVSMQQPLSTQQLAASLLKWQRPISERTLCLNGVWDFRWSPIAEAAPASMVPESGGGNWCKITVPSSIQTQGFGTPVYTNIQYPFPLPPPELPAGKVPRQNEVGDYHRKFEVPSAWMARANRSDEPLWQIYLILEGVESCASVFVDGVRVGFSKDSRTPAEFNITKQLHAGADALHSLAVRTYRYSDGSMLEDQDHWRLSGIHRDVRLVCLPSAAAIRDFEVRATADGALSLVASVASYTTSTPPGNCGCIWTHHSGCPQATAAQCCQPLILVVPNKAALQAWCRSDNVPRIL
eukprot:SAG31_NODE_7287_length_1731_cov_1.481005_2_plen_389_part_00